MNTVEKVPDFQVLFQLKYKQTRVWKPSVAMKEKYLEAVTKTKGSEAYLKFWGKEVVLGRNLH